MDYKSVKLIFKHLIVESYISVGSQVGGKIHRMASIIEIEKKNCVLVCHFPLFPMMVR